MTETPKNLSLRQLTLINRYMDFVLRQDERGLNRLEKTSVVLEQSAAGKPEFIVIAYSVITPADETPASLMKRCNIALSFSGMFVGRWFSPTFRAVRKRGYATMALITVFKDMGTEELERQFRGHHMTPAAPGDAIAFANAHPGAIMEYPTACFERVTIKNRSFPLTYSLTRTGGRIRLTSERQDFWRKRKPSAKPSTEPICQILAVYDEVDE